MNKTQIIFITILLIFFGLLFCFKTGQPSLFEEDEARVSEVAREILVTGKWIDLQHNFEPWFHKPPLYPWLTAVAFYVFGVGEFSARIWAALFGIGAVIVVFFIGKILYDEATAGLSSIILGSSLLFVALSRAGFVDTGLTFFVALSILFFLIGYKEVDKKYFIVLSALGVALGTLIKGPLGIIVPGSSILIYLIIQRDIAFFSRYLKEILWGVLVYVIVAAPWWIAETVIHGRTFLEGLFGQYMIGIYSTAFQKHSGPFYYYLIVLLIGMIPWGIHTGYGLISALGRDERKRSLLLLIWVAVPFIIFSSAQTKVPGYILPLFPPLSIITAKALKDNLFADAARSQLVNAATFGGLVVLTAILFAATFLVKVELEYLKFLIMFRWMFAAFLVLSAISLVLVNIAKLAPLSIVPLIIISVVFVMVASEFILPAVECYKPAKRMVLQVREFLPKGIPVQYYNYKTWFRSSLPFYLKSKVTIIDSKSELIDILKDRKNAVVFTDTNAFGKIQRELPPWTIRIDRKWDLVAFTNINL